MIGVVLIFRDVTEQRRAERELRASEARKAAILETALDCIITMDHEGKVVEFNPAAERTFGYSRAEVVGRELAELHHPAVAAGAHRRGMAHYLATGEGPVLGQAARTAGPARGRHASSRSSWRSPGSRPTARRCSRPTCATSPSRSAPSSDAASALRRRRPSAAAGVGAGAGGVIQAVTSA